MKVLSIIKQAVVSLVTNDSSSYPQGQATHNGKATDYTRLSPYGLVSNPPQGSWVLLLSSMAQSAVKFGIASDMLGRIKGLKEGECGLYNPLTKSFVLLLENGDCSADIKGDLIASATGKADITAATEINFTAPNINLTGIVTINGIPFGTHKHPITGGSSAPGPTGNPQ